jgi:2-C-methyl-D-erythritol 4-phosphate cytidylyltransferase
VSETVAIVSAAGSGQRLGAGIPKAYVPLVGRTILEHALDGLVASGVVSRVIVAAPPSRVAETAELLAGRATVVAGGAERHDTVRLALEHVGEPDFVLVHDAARPMTPVDQFRRVVAALED